MSSQSNTRLCMRRKLYEGCSGKYTCTDPLPNPKIMLHTFSDSKMNKLEINKVSRKCSNDWQLNKKLLPQIKEEFIRTFENILNLMEMESNKIYET